MDFDRALTDIRAAFAAGGYDEPQRVALIGIIAAAEWGRAISLGLADANETAHERERDMGEDGPATYRRGFHDGHEFLRVRTGERMSLFLENPLGQIEPR